MTILGKHIVVRGFFPDSLRSRDFASLRMTDRGTAQMTIWGSQDDRTGKANWSKAIPPVVPGLRFTNSFTIQN